MQNDRFCKLAEVEAIVGLKKSSIYNAIEDFPRPVKIGRGSAWSYQELMNWVAERKAARDGGRHD